MRNQSNTFMQLIFIFILSFCLEAKEKEYFSGKVFADKKLMIYSFQLVKGKGPYEIVISKGSESCRMRVLSLSAPKQTQGHSGLIKIMPGKCWSKISDQKDAYQVTIDYRLYENGWRGFFYVESRKKQTRYLLEMSLSK